MRENDRERERRKDRERLKCKYLFVKIIELNWIGLN